MINNNNISLSSSSFRSIQPLGYLLLIASIISVVLGAAPVTTDKSCPYQPLPTSFDSYNYLGFNQDFHIQDTFYYDFLSFIKDITFNITVPSAFRFYVAPHTVDVDIWLYHSDPSNKTPVTHSTDSTPGLDETVFATLAPGSYKLRLLFFKAASGSKMACPTLTIEAAISPVATVNTNVAATVCPASQNQFPTLTFDVSSGIYRYDSDVNDAATVFNFVDQQATGKANNLTYVKGYNFTLPSDVIATDKWGVEVTIGSHFLTGGSVGVMIVNQNMTIPPIQTGLSACLQNDGCIIGQHITKGHSTLKSVLIPGDYTLWIYDQTQEKDFTLSGACTIFSLAIDIESAHETETFLNCDSYNLPTSFDDPGFIDDGGYLYFADNVFLDLLTGSDIVNFTIDTPSYIRVYIPEHRVDIDVEILDSSDGSIVTSSFKWGGEEDITAQLTPGKYAIKVMFFGNNIDTFCDTFYIEIGIAPTTDYTTLNYCNGITANVLPDVSGMSTLNAAGEYYFNGTQFYQMFSGQSNPVTIVSQTFNLTQVSYFYAAAGFNFILGDIRLSVTLDNQDDDGDEQTVVYDGDHSRNLNQLVLTLEPGNYTFLVTTASTSKNSTYFPPCVPFSLNVSIESAEDDDPCWGTANYFPTSLNVPAYLGTSTSIQITDTFLVPPVKLIVAPAWTTTFTVSVDSYFRAYSQQDSIDVDLTLNENGKRVVWSNQFNGDESIEYVLTKGKNYTLVTSFYKWPLYPSSDCYTYTAQLSIAPQSEKPKDVCNPAVLPPLNWIPNASATVFDQTGDFMFTQNTTQFSTQLPFSVTKQNALFRAIITFDFVWNDVMIALFQADGTLVISGTTFYNKVDILPTLLSQGNYYLRVYEPFKPSSGKFNINTCVEFTLRVALQLADDASTNQDTIVCQSLLFPQTFNSIGYLSTLTGQQLYFQQTVLADVQNAKDNVQFTLTTKSLVRIYIPVHSSLDIDLVLANAATGKTISSSRTTGEEITYNLLSPGTYLIKFTYYGLNGPLPKVEDCVDFPIFISIVPTSTLDAVPSITQQCDASATDLPDFINGNQLYSGTFMRSLAVTQQPQSMVFTINQTGLFTTTVQYNDAVASLAIKLNSTIIVNGISTVKYYHALYDGGQAYINEVLPAGKYQLNVYDPYSSVSPYNNVQCATYTLGYFLNTSTPAGQTCSTTNVLPSSLNSNSATPYGGPQNSVNGEILFMNDHFYLSNAADKKHNYITFNVPKEPVYMRLYASPDPNNDIDFHLYTNGSDPNSLIYSSFSNQAEESSLWLLQPQSTPYTLDVMFFRVNKKSPCNYFHFELAIETVTHITNDLLCPNPLPNEVDQVPPESIEFPYGQDVTLGSDTYLFTYARIQNNLRPGSNVFRYRMSLEVSAPLVLYAEVGYDYLDNDFALSLSTHNVDGSTTLVTTGQKGLPTSTDSAYNFLNMIQVNLTTGNYFLDINEDLSQSPMIVNSSICHFFSFHIIAESTVDGIAPRILGILPPSGFNLNPALPLILNVRFSEPIGYNLAQNLLDYINNLNAVYLKTDKIGILVQPNSAQIKKKDKTTLVVTFFPVNASAFYTLNVDASQFSTLNGVKFAQENSSALHIYNMFQCDCSGHGTCISANNDWSCVCTDPWAGSDCSKCKNGYHGAGNTCIQNTQCQADSCNGNGKCNDQDGFPECTCNLGFTTTDPTELCGSCDYGYYGYPNCSMSSEDEGTLCIAPLMPSSLSTIEYLTYNNRLHIQDNYYIDMDSGSHTIFIQITQPSVMRVYSEPHKVDIDLWLYSLNPDGSYAQNVDRGITFGHEEVMLDTLPVGNYALVFKYYLWDRSITIDCETFNMELQIDTTADLAEDMANWSDICDHPGNMTEIPAYFVLNKPYSSHSTATYTLPYSGTGAQGIYLWNTTFTVQPPQVGQVGLLNAAIGYQFLQGELAIVLQSGIGQPKCKGGDQTGVTGCVFGDNEINRNVLNAVLQPGNYTLFIYAPAQMYVMDCAAFDLNIDISFVNDDEDYFNCDGELLPSSFDNSQFLRNGYLHVQDLYYMDQTHYTVSFTLATTSYVRIAADQEGATITLSLYDPVANQTYVKQGMVFVAMAQGQFVLTVSTDYVASSINFCPLMNMEIEIEPSPLVATTSCPADGRDRVPLIPNVHVPFTFESTLNPRNTYYSFMKQTTAVAQYSFSLSGVTNFYTAVASDFLRSDLRVNLYRRLIGGQYTLFISGFHDYNYNFIDANLDPGSYLLKIERPNFYYNATGLPNCTPFEFEFSLVPLSKVALCAGERIPQTLNSVRFLGLEGFMHYESSNFIVPPSNGTMFSFQNIPFTVQQASIMRVYTSPNAIDIDIKLVDPNNVVVATGSNGLNGEESFITALKPNVGYTLQIQFWRWSSKIAVCNNFNMEIAIGPNQTASDQSICTGGQNLWPQDLPSTLPPVYWFSSMDSNTPLAFQQSVALLQSHGMPFKLNNPANFHAEVGFDFLTGDLSLKLVNTNTKKVIYGDVRPNRNTLDVQALPSGTYTLYIYEPYTALPSIMGCSSFNFELLIDQTSAAINQTDGFYHYIPQSLDTYSYLKYNGAVHLQGEYLMYDDVPAHNTVQFTLKYPSLVRVQAVVLPSEEADIYTEVISPRISISTQTDVYGSALVVLQPGLYTITIGEAFTSFPLPSAVDLEIAIQSTDRVTKDLNGLPSAFPPTCPTTVLPTIVVSPLTNSYMYNDQQTIAYTDIVKGGIVQTIEFTILVPSLVYVQIGYQFITADLDVQITSSNSYIFGRSNRNVNEINAILEPGTYTIQITNPIAFVNQFDAHCTPYHLIVNIRDASQANNHIDCSTLDPLPTDLNSNGSIPYGGPIDGSGTLTMYSPNFLIPLQPVQNVTFFIGEPTLISVYTSEQLAASIDYQVVNPITQQIQPVLYTLGIQNNNQRSALFFANASTSGDTSMVLSMMFSGKLKDNCPNYAMQVAMLPLSLVMKDFTCPSNFNPSLPSSPKINGQGYSSDYLVSSIPGYTLSPNATDNTTTGWKYSIPFTLTRVSHVEAMFSFNSIVNNFIIQIAQVPTSGASGNPHVIGTGQWSSQYTSGTTTLTQSLINNRLNAGQYVLTITHPPMTSFVGASIYGDLCFPFIYSLLILDAQTVYAGQVSPASGYNLSPLKNLPIQLAFSEPFNGKNGQPVTCSNGNNIIQQAFVLLDLNNNVNTIFATSASCSSSDGLTWSITFANSSLASNGDYLLQLRNGYIFDTNGNAAVLPPQHQYSMIDTSCSGAGKFSGSQCICQQEYTGVVCGTCAVGYTDVNPVPGTPTCVVDQCHINTCGCDPTITQYCVPIGQCAPTEAGFECSCPPAYNGTQCDKCSFGYTGYPYCKATYDCGGCGKGSCDQHVGTCSCPSNFQGDHCESCAPGYNGSDCKKDGSGAIIALEVIASIVAGAIVIGGAVWYVRHRFRAGVARYKMLPKFEIEDDDDRGSSSKFPGLYDSGDEEENDNQSSNYYSINNNNSSNNKKSTEKKPKQHVFSFKEQSTSIMDDSDEDNNNNNNQTNTFNDKTKSLFDI
ncbi:hypothetical protein DFA_04136 [Cavenderia fasciculata]|uniref:EGF-like domain-containing protein n=1 Tax=Cavenderia fasciculata TaxID=261658 RepID=F4Q1E0_CACFS|nr:uncharacterized protein DFA_04136 [Cavenderia fasciculata]EGG18641.1 hypothetical protein DFA_04136 [Cavenderia fasciculata]|eukprot:XP_004366545.1 hypothetical protein DFA_04136 [Cavenderia fasciculata]